MLWGLPESSSDAFSPNERRPKRRKLESQRNSQNTPHILDGSEDEDLLMADDIVHLRHIQPASQDVKPAETKSFISQDSSKPAKQNGCMKTGVPEFHRIESYLDSSRPNHKKRRDSQKRRARDSSGTPRSSFTSSHSDHIEQLESQVLMKPAARPPYQGTANLYRTIHSQAAVRGKFGRSTGHRSPHFPMSNTAKPAEGRKPVKSTVNDGPILTGTQLRDQYHDTDGRRRSDVDPSSPDVLVTASSNSRALSPIKTIHSQTSVEILHHDSSGPPLVQDESFDVQQAQSNIRQATFTQLVKHAVNPKSRPHSGMILEGKPAPWRLEIRAYYSRGDIHQGDSLGLVYNDKTKSYDIHQSGQNLAKFSPELRLQPVKLQKIFWAMEGTKMRFESSRVGKVDNILDIELCSEKDVQELNAVLQESEFMMVKGEHKEKMDRLFNHRLEMHQKEIASGRFFTSKEPEDVILAGRRVERADRESVPEEQPDNKRKRRRIVDGLGFDGQSNSTHQPSFRQPSEVRRTPRNQKVVAQDQPDELSLTPLENMLTRSLRSHKERASSSRKPVDTLRQGFEPEIQRYSKTHDMGPRWVKPVVYPKEGKKRTTVAWDDLERLDEGEFLNDNLVAFFMRYLEHRAEQRDPSVTRNIYMFNTFFYERLTDTKRGHKGINYEAVRKWTRGVDLFTYDFVIVPVNESYHWYVAIICNLPALNRKLGGFEANLEEEDFSATEHSNSDHMHFSSSPPKAGDDVEQNETTASFAEMSLEQKKSTDQNALDSQLQDSRGEGSDDIVREAHPPEQTDMSREEIKDMEKPTSPKLNKGKRKSGPPPRTFNSSKPTILTLDSLGMTHSTAIRALKQYLHEEANDKRGQMEFDEKELQGVTAKDIPQQSNWYDCGLYILGYIEKFFDDPRDFIDRVMGREWKAKEDWPNLDPRIMRHNIRKLLKDLYADQYRDGIEARRSKTKSKSPNVPTSSSTTERIAPPSNVDGDGQLNGSSPRPGPGEGQHAVSPSKAASHPVQAVSADQRELYNAGPKSLKGSKADRKPLSEIHPSPKTPHEEPPQSFILINSQLQQVNTAIPTNDPELPGPLAVSPQRPSTIPDSQPPLQVAETPLEELLSPSPPRSKKFKGKRVDSFSSPPPAPKAAPKPEEVIKSPKDTHDTDMGPIIPKTRGKKRISCDMSRSIITGTDPKIVINIDD